MAGLRYVFVLGVFLQILYPYPTHFWAHLVSALGLLTGAQEQVQQVKVKVEAR